MSETSTTYTYGPWEILIEREGNEPDYPWTWHASKDGVDLLEGKGSSTSASALEEAAEACRAYPDEDE